MATLVHNNVDGISVLKLTGNLDHDGVEAIKAQFAAEAQGSGSLVVDLSGVELICTPSIGMLLAAHRDMQRAGGRMILAGAGQRVADVLRTCQLDRVFTLVAALPEAIKRAKA